jgi:hypothetical protein
MKGNLEDFIRDNRKEFDSEEPSPKLWTKIQEDLVPPQKKTVFNLVTVRRWMIAASVVIALATGTYLLLPPKSDPSVTGNIPGQEINDPNKILHEINPTYAKEVYHFTQLIELKQNELKQIGKDQPELYNQFMGDIINLDSSYNALKKELPANPNREQLLEAMIQNLQLQTELLNQQLRIIKQIKQSKTSSNENNSKII